MLSSPFEQNVTLIYPNHSLERNIWVDHTDPIINPLERAWWLLGRDYLFSTHTEAHGVLGLPSLDDRALYDAHRVTIAKASNWNSAASRFGKLTRKRSGFGYRDLQSMAGITVDRWYSHNRIETRAKARAMRTWLSGYLLNNQKTPIPRGVPSSIDEARRMLELNRRDVASLEYATQAAAQHVQNMRDSSKGALNDVVVNAVKNNTHPNETAQDMLERFGKLNRDWRRIAITETNGAYHGGMLGALVGKTVVWVAAGDACEHCRQYHNHEFLVVAPDDPNKDWDRHLWAGKNNVGLSFHRYARGGRRRSDSEMAKPAIPMHPHCRCRVRPTLDIPRNMDSDLRDYITKKLAV